MPAPTIVSLSALASPPPPQDETATPMAKTQHTSARKRFIRAPLDDVPGYRRHSPNLETPGRRNRVWQRLGAEIQRPADAFVSSSSAVNHSRTSRTGRRALADLPTNPDERVTRRCRLPSASSR